MASTAAGPTVPPVRELRRRLRRVRRTHSDRTLGELLTDVYLITFVVALYGGSAVVSLHRHLAKPTGGPVGLETTRAWLILAILAVTATLAWRGLTSFGPLLTTPAAQSWCLSTPIDRAGWLRLPLIWVLGAAAVAGAGAGVLAGWLGLPTSAAWAGLSGAAAGVGIAAASVRAQSRRPRRPGRIRPNDLALLACLLLVAAAVVTRATHVRVGPPAVPAAGIAALAVAGAVLAVRAALAALAQIDRAALAGGAQLATATVGAAVMLDPALLSGVVEARRWRQPRRIHSRHWWPGGRAWVLIQADLLRQWRRRSGLLAWAALVLVPYAVAVYSPAAVGPARIAAAYLATERLAAGLRLIARTPSLRRLVGGGDGDLKSIHLVVPAIGLAIWWLASLGAGGAATRDVIGPLLVLGVLGAVYRTATRPPMSYDVGTADTPMGPVPTTLLRRLLRGPDVVAILILADLIF